MKDMDEPIAGIRPPGPVKSSWHERMIQDGRLRPGTQDWARLHISKIPKPVDIQSSLDAVREDSSEVRRRQRRDEGAVL